MSQRIKKRHTSRGRIALCLASAVSMAVAAPPDDSAPPTATPPAAVRETIEFDRDIRPVLADNCFKCHGPDERKRKADLRLDQKRGALADIGGYFAIVPGNASESELYRRITAGDAADLMPPPKSGKKLTPAQIELVRRWIDQGAVWREHWAFASVERPAVPRVSDHGWPRNPIDRFVLARLEKSGIEPSPEADRTTLIRRLHLDLIGLLPTPEDVDAFTRDDEPHAYERLVERLLASQHHGERWGKHWLDQARYADSNGYSIDGPRDMWPYRDWVIQAINDDMPFDRFTVEQIAGDLLPEATESQRIATGFHRNTLINQEGGTDHEQFRVESVVDRVNTTGAVWLGLTLGCAHCHSHKFDPISQREYFQLYAFFNNCEDRNSRDPVLQIPLPGHAEATRRLQAARKELEDHGDASDREALVSQVKKLEAEQKKLMATTMILRERERPRATHVHIRGDFLRTGDKVEPAVPAVLAPALESTGRATRLDLARWLVDPRHPLTARVAMNRVWMRYFGRGLVETENDFGVQGTLPTHPELLDWLATEFVRRGWSLKAMHRLIVSSATYRQSSRVRPELAEADPANRLLARQARFRVEAEIIRDATLSASGLLSRRIGGPSVHPPQPDGVYAFTQVKREWTASQGPDRYRRALYTFFFRNAPYPLLTTFDAPDFSVSCTRRFRSNTPLQSLTLANDEALVEIAQGLAARLHEDVQGEDSLRERMIHGFRLCLARPPTERELSALVEFHRLQLRRFKDDPEAAERVRPKGHAPAVDAVSAAAWVATARVLTNLDEFITRE